MSAPTTPYRELLGKNTGKDTVRIKPEQKQMLYQTVRMVRKYVYWVLLSYDPKV